MLTKRCRNTNDHRITLCQARKIRRGLCLPASEGRRDPIDPDVSDVGPSSLEGLDLRGVDVEPENGKLPFGEEQRGPARPGATADGRF